MELSRRRPLKPIHLFMRKTLFFLLFLAASFPIMHVHAEVLSTDASSSSETESVETAAVAKITSLEGDVRILKKDSDNWQAAKKDQTIEAGDQILTGKNSSADIAYDAYLLNITHIQEQTKAEFRSIVPTDIYLEDGSIFSALDGLEENGQYQIATPTAVAGVRGTHFDVAFDKNTQKFTSAALPSGEEGHESIIYIRDPKKLTEEPVVLRENKQLDLRFGEKIEMNRVRAAEPGRLQAGQKVFHQMGQRMPQFQERREQGKMQLQQNPRPRQGEPGRPGINNPQQRPLQHGMQENKMNGSQNGGFQRQENQNFSGNQGPRENRMEQPFRPLNVPQQQQHHPQQQPQQMQQAQKPQGPPPPPRKK